MISIEKLRVIAKAKFSDKSKLGDWYKKRLEICEECPLNSRNKENKTAREKRAVALNLGKPTCLGCGCEIAAKASVRSERCGMTYIGQKPLWEALPDTEKTVLDSITVENLNPEKAEITIEHKGLGINYGTVPKGFDSNVTFLLESKKGPITTLKVTAGCGCTTTQGIIEDGKGSISVAYDTVGRVGPVTKTVNIYYTAGNKKHVLMCKLQINVEK